MIQVGQQTMQVNQQRTQQAISRNGRGTDAQWNEALQATKSSSAQAEAVTHP
jgi:hypothetical protein